MSDYTFFTQFNIVDLVVFVLVLLSGIIGVFRGLTREILSLAGWVGAALLAFYSLPYGRPYIKDYIANPFLGDVALGVCVFLLSLIVLTFLSSAISARIKKSPLGGIDHTFGLIFGLTRGVFLITLIYIVAITFRPPQKLPPMIQTAKSLTIVLPLAQWFVDLLPEDIREKLNIPEIPTGEYEEFKGPDIVEQLSRPKPKGSEDTPKDSEEKDGFMKFFEAPLGEHGK